MSAYNPWHPMKDPVDLKTLGKLGEEGGEMVTVVNRCIIQGMDGVNPRDGQINKEWLEDEIADVLANIWITIRRFGLNLTRILKRAGDKKSKLLTWHAMA